MDATAEMTRMMLMTRVLETTRRKLYIRTDERSGMERGETRHEIEAIADLLLMSVRRRRLSFCCHIWHAIWDDDAVGCSADNLLVFIFELKDIESDA